MEIRSNDPLLFQTTISYYIKDFDMNFISYMISSLNKDRQVDKSFAYSFTTEGVSVLVDYSSNERQLTIRISNDTDTLVIKRNKDKASLNRITKEDDFLLTIINEDNGNYTLITEEKAKNPIKKTKHS